MFRLYLKYVFATYADIDSLPVTDPRTDDGKSHFRDFQVRCLTAGPTGMPLIHLGAARYAMSDTCAYI